MNLQRLCSALVLFSAVTSIVASPKMMSHHASAGKLQGQPADKDEFDLFFRFLDRDQNGQLEAYEGAEALLLLASRAGTNRDSSLGLGEVRSFLKQSRVQELFEREEIFEELDSNQDGALTRFELPDMLRDVLAQADQDRDGELSFEELAGAEGLENPAGMIESELLEFFGKADQDGDGAFALADLPEDERAGYASRFKRLDADANGLLSRGELLAQVDEELRGATFEVQGTRALMRGVIGASTPGRVLRLVLEHPEVRMIEMLDVPGSMDDEANVRAARLVRRMGLNTHLPAQGMVASGGTDFFQAGVQRSAEAGARFGVHSWNGLNEEGRDLPRDHPEHAMYLDYCREMDIPEQFYWYTLDAAPAAGIHWMSQEELERFQMLNTIAPSTSQTQPTRSSTPERPARQE